MKIWIKTGALIAAVWLVAAVVIHFANASHPTAETVAAYVQSLNLDAMQSADRAKAIEKMEDMVNRITFDDRQQLDRERITKEFFDKLTEEEKGAYLDATLPTGFAQLMDSFNKMDPVKRKQIVNQALERMKEHPGPPPNVAAGDQNIAQHVIDQGLKSFYKDADADVKLDLAPLVEQMQRNLEHP